MLAVAEGNVRKPKIRFVDIPIALWFDTVLVCHKNTHGIDKRLENLYALDILLQKR